MVDDAAGPARVSGQKPGRVSYPLTEALVRVATVDVAGTAKVLIRQGNAAITGHPLTIKPALPAPTPDWLLQYHRGPERLYVQLTCSLQLVK